MHRFPPHCAMPVSSVGRASVGLLLTGCHRFDPCTGSNFTAQIRLWRIVRELLPCIHINIGIHTHVCMCVCIPD